MVDFSKIYSTEEGIAIDDTTGIIAGDLDPSTSSPGTNIPESTLYIRRDNNTVYQKVGSGNTDWELLSLFGSSYQQAGSSGYTVTIGTAPVTKLTLTTAALVAGSYRVGWSYKYSSNANTNSFRGIVDFDGSILDEVIDEPSESKANKKSADERGSVQAYSASGFSIQNIVGVATTHTITIKFNSLEFGNNSSIWDARLEIWRVS